MKLNDDQQVLYDFFCQMGKVKNSVDYPLMLLNSWCGQGYEGFRTTECPDKNVLTAAYQRCLFYHTLDKPLYEAVKTLKGWK